MTIAVAVKTGSAVVFAADSKVTTSGIVGFEESGEPRWMEQTYDNATKVVHDPSMTLMAIVAGYANIGQETAMDFVMSHKLPELGTAGNQDEVLGDYVNEMVRKKKEYWEAQNVESTRWTRPTLLLAAPSSVNNRARLWRVDLQG